MSYTEIKKPQWRTEWPDAEGLWLFHGWPFGNRQQNPPVPATTTAVRVSRTGDGGLVLVGDGHFWYKQEGALGWWQKFQVDEPVYCQQCLKLMPNADPRPGARLLCTACTGLEMEVEKLKPDRSRTLEPGAMAWHGASHRAVRLAELRPHGYWTCQPIDGSRAFAAHKNELELIGQ